MFLETKPNYPKQQVLMQLMNEVNTKIGKETLKRCSEGLKSIENERKPA
ncbi:hypothetical protein PRO82_001389 [Candidatus Protochlamydia amoebophila]|nr:hypothetical protein [Candidatus Protochlamydia amoebophila]